MTDNDETIVPVVWEESDGTWCRGVLHFDIESTTSNPEHAGRMTDVSTIDEYVQGFSSSDDALRGWTEAGSPRLQVLVDGSNPGLVAVVRRAVGRG